MLGEEEIQQIFILYPVVLHKAYEEKVPLELSDEQAIMAKKGKCDRGRAIAVVASSM